MTPQPDTPTPPVPTPPTDFAPPPAGAFRHLFAILILPGNVLATIPAVLLWRFGFDTFDLWTVFPFTRYLLPISSLLFGTLGLTLMIATIRLFASRGRGTLAPWIPPQRLVVEGPYRYVRNPMISGVCCILVAESLGFASAHVAGWTLAFWLINAIVIPLGEEHGLRKRFGEEYVVYCANVPRWIPRFTPWKPTAQVSS